ncbi:DUF4179 domain-containing protein [Cytobacillus praedii]|uniref:DUF4179 domain-containing protein n=1 Tax=Cytobacillus praedii TaxID=1742358 RepID=A0A4R1ATT0_9BACI|nr:DUF4179 domain-containing protein [Cytobacillus praedii]TCJ01009.1 DUF4179 domain-containing protein [Cytobacillus praedii]
MGGYLNDDKKVQSSRLFEEVAFNQEDQLQVYAKLKERRDCRSVIGKKKRVLMPAVILLMMVSAVIYMSSNPVLALAKLPFFESIFQFLGDGGLKGAATEDKQDIQQQQREGGITMEIKEAVYDGMRLSISYSIKSEDPIKNFSSHDINLHFPNVGRLIGGRNSSNQFTQVSEHEVIGYSMFTYAVSKMPDEFKADFLYKGTINNRQEQNFKFIFKVPIKMTPEIKKVAFTKKASYEGEELTLKQITLSPISTAFKLQHKEPYQNKLEDDWLTIRLLDQEDRVIKEVSDSSSGGWGGTQIKQDNRWYSLREATLLFEPLDEEVKDLKIQLFKNKSNEDLVIQERLVELSEAKNQLFNLGERGTMKITDIKQEDHSAVIKYEYKSSFAFYQNFSPVMLKSAEGNWHHGIEMKREYLGNNTYIVEELFLDLPKDKLSVRYLQEKAPELIEELEIKVSADEMR